MKHIKILAFLGTVLIAFGGACKTDDTTLIDPSDKKINPDKSDEVPSQGGVNPSDILPHSHGDEEDEDVETHEPSKLHGFYFISTPTGADMTPYFNVEITSAQDSENFLGILNAIESTAFWSMNDRIDIDSESSTFKDGHVKMVFAGTVGEQPTLAIEWDFQEEGIASGKLIDLDNGETIRDVNVRKVDYTNIDNTETAGDDGSQGD